MSRRTTTVEVYLDDFSDSDLIHELKARGLLTEGEAKRLERRLEPLGAVIVDSAECEVAWAEARIGRRQEALIHIERALGSEWIGLLA